MPLLRSLRVADCICSCCILVVQAPRSTALREPIRCPSSASFVAPTRVLVATGSSPVPLPPSPRLASPPAPHPLPTAPSLPLGHEECASTQTNAGAVRRGAQRGVRGRGEGDRRDSRCRSQRTGPMGRRSAHPACSVSLFRGAEGGVRNRAPRCAISWVAGMSPRARGKKREKNDNKPASHARQIRLLVCSLRVGGGVHSCAKTLQRRHRLHATQSTAFDSPVLLLFCGELWRARLARCIT